MLGEMSCFTRDRGRWEKNECQIKVEITWMRETRREKQLRKSGN